MSLHKPTCHILAEPGFSNVHCDANDQPQNGYRDNLSFAAESHHTYGQ